jgi:hypothetical protein
MLPELVKGEQRNTWQNPNRRCIVQMDTSACLNGEIITINLTHRNIAYDLYHLTLYTWVHMTFWSVYG